MPMSSSITSSIVMMPMGSPGLAMSGTGSMSSRSSREEPVSLLLVLSLLLLLSSPWPRNARGPCANAPAPQQNLSERAARCPPPQST